MYKAIKQLADEAIALQNKDRMDAVLREISGMCATAPAMMAFGENDHVHITYGSVAPAPAVDLAAKLADAKPGDVVLPTGDETKAASATKPSIKDLNATTVAAAGTAIKAAAKPAKKGAK